MTDVDQSVELELEPPPRGKSPLKFWGLIAAAVLFAGGAGGAAWYFLLGGNARPVSEQAKPVEAPLPVFLDLKPIVITVSSRAGPSHFVQLGASFQVSGSSASEMITALLPKVQDTIRQTLLNFKSDDLQTPEGVDRARAALLRRLNGMLKQELGPERIERGNPHKVGEGLIHNIYFATLVIE